VNGCQCTIIVMRFASQGLSVCLLCFDVSFLIKSTGTLYSKLRVIFLYTWKTFEFNYYSYLIV
jgi:hypothetical protein